MNRRRLYFLMAFLGSLALVSAKLKWPGFIVGGMSIGFALRWCLIHQPLNQDSRPLERIVTISGIGLFMVLSGGLFHLGDNPAFIDLMFMWGCASSGVALAELVNVRNPDRSEGTRSEH